MNKFLRFIPLLLLLAYLSVKITVYVNTDDAPTIPPFAPTPTQKAHLFLVQESLKNHPEAASNFSNLFKGLSLVVAKDQTILRTTGDVRRTHQNAGALAIQVGEVPPIPGFSEAVNVFLEGEIGNDNVPLDNAKRNQISEAFRALSWATNQ